MKGLAAALDAGRMGGLVSRHLCGGEAIEGLNAYYIRYKGSDGAVVGWRVRLAGGTPEVPVTVRVAALDRLRSEAERFEDFSSGHSPWVRATALVEESGVLLIGFPFDRSLRGLRKLVRLMWLKEFAGEHLSEIVTPGWRVSRESTFELVRYKPERRAVLRWDLVLRHRERRERRPFSCYFRLHADESAARAIRMQSAAAGFGIPCPRPIAVISNRLQVETVLPGRPFDLHAHGAEAQVEAAGELLAKLHGAPISFEEGRRAPGDELDRCRQAVADLDELDPESSAMAEAVVDRLAKVSPASRDDVALHGDFHSGQILFDGASAGLVDFDRTHVGHAAYDLASFEAHLVLDGHPRAGTLAHSLKRGYEGRRTVPDEGSRRWYLACALLTKASSPFRGLQADWPERTRRLVRMAADEAGVKA